MALAVVIAGCWTEAAEPVKPVAAFEQPRPREKEVVRPPRPPRMPDRTVWTGTYTCSQGLTGVTLTLDLTPGPSDRIDAVAVFEFFPVPQNPNPVKPGATRLLGSAKELGDGGFAVDLDPDSWVIQPGGYTMVGATFTIDGPQRELHGTIKHPNCGAIDATRDR